MQDHLDAQTKTGRLTAYEADAVLAHFRLQQQYESKQTSSPRKPKPVRIDWSILDSMDPDKHPPVPSTSRATSYASTSGTELSRKPSFTASSASHSPFPYSSADSVPAVPSTQSSPPPAFKRSGGGSTMFGSQVRGLDRVKMSQKASSSNLREKRSSGNLQGSPSSTSRRGRTSSSDAQDLDSESQDLLTTMTMGPLSPASTEPLSPRSISRISQVLDDIAAELSLAYMQVPDDDETPDFGELEIPSPTSATGPQSPLSDTETVDPFLQRLSKIRPSMISVPSKRDSKSTGIAPSTSLRTLGEADLPTPTALPDQERPEAFGMPPSHDSQQSIASIASHAASSRSKTSEMTMSPDRSHRSKRSMTDGSEEGGPFNLSYTSMSPVRADGSDDLQHHYTTGSTATSRGSHLFSPFMNGSTTSVDSAASSFHGEQAKDEDDLSLFHEETPSPVIPSQDAAMLHIEAADMSRRPSNELIEETRKGLAPDAPEFAIEDLVAVQESLVRAASQRAQRDKLAQSTTAQPEVKADAVESENDHVVIEAASPVVIQQEESSVSMRADPSQQSEFSSLTISTPLEGSSAVVTPSTGMVDAFEFSNVVTDSPSRKASEVAEPEDQTEELQDLETVPDESISTRDRTRTPSVLLRDVQSQADLATAALKKSSLSTRRVTRSKSVRNVAISSPQLISAPSDIPAVPIENLPTGDATIAPRHAAGRARSKSFSSRFKKLLNKKQSRDQDLNGEEVTPFTDASSWRASTRTVQDSPSLSSQAGETDSPNLSESVASTVSSAVPSPHLARSDSSRKAADDSVPAPSSLTRLVSKIRRPRATSESSNGREQTHKRNVSTASKLRPAQLDLADAADASNAAPEEVLADTHPSGRAPIAYDINDRRRPFDSSPTIPQTEPLNLVKTSSRERTSHSPPRTSGPTSPARRHRQNASIDSMTQLAQAAEDLGMTPDKVQELVDLSYASSPTSPFRQGQSHFNMGHGRTSSDFSTPSMRPLQRESFEHGSLGDTSNARVRLEQMIQEEEHDGNPLANPKGLSIRIPPRQFLGPEEQNFPPVSPSEQSVISFHSGYAGSVFDLYGEDEGDPGHQSSEGDLKSPTSIYDNGSPIRSRHLSTDTTKIRLTAEDIGQLLRHHRRNDSSQTDSTYDRSMSVYVRDEERLEALAREKGGIAEEERGKFLTRDTRHQGPSDA